MRGFRAPLHSNEIDKKVLADLQKTIAIPFRVEIEREKYGKKYTDIYVNLLAWEYAKNITSTDACGIFTSTSEDGTYNVMNSRGGDMSNIEPDIEFLQSIDKSMWNDNQTCTSWANDPNIFYPHQDMWISSEVFVVTVSVPELSQTLYDEEAIQCDHLHLLVYQALCLWDSG